MTIMQHAVKPAHVADMRSTVDLGRNLGLDVVAEGVENQEVWDRLKTLGCTTAQGYYLSRPLPPSELQDWLLKQSQTMKRHPGRRTRS